MVGETDRIVFCSNCHKGLTRFEVYEETFKEAAAPTSAIIHFFCSKECYFAFKDKKRLEYGKKPVKHRDPKHGSGNYRVIRCDACKRYQAIPENYSTRACVCGKHIDLGKVQTLFIGPADEARKKVFELSNKQIAG